jgi:hypothetical protein
MYLVLSVNAKEGQILFRKRQELLELDECPAKLQNLPLNHDGNVLEGYWHCPRATQMMINTSTVPRHPPPSFFAP